MADERLTEQTEQIELLSFDPIVVVLDVLRRWYVVVCVALIAAMAAYVFTELRYEPRYTTETTFVVSTQESSSTVYQNLSAASNLATTLSEVFNSSLMRKTVSEVMGTESFHGTISASAIEETNLLTMRVTDTDPRSAFLATRAIIEHHQEISSRIMGEIVLEVLQQPKVPSGPSNRADAMGTAKKAGLLCGAAACGLLLLIAFLRDTVRSASEAKKKLHCRVLGELRHERKHRSLRAVLHRQKTSILISNPLTSFSYTEKLRTLRRKVEQHLPEGGKVILVTSALENEGKSTVAVNLALSFAQKRRRVLLIDCDLRKPACCKILNLPWGASGTAAVASGSARPEEAIVPYIEGKSLDLLLEGRAVRGSSDLAGSHGMAALIDWARERYDIVILDTPPMLAGPDAEAFADLADAAILVVRQNQAETRLLCNALEVLRGAEAKVLGCVLNNCYTSVLSEQSNYGYGYGHYGHYGKYGRYGAYGPKKEEQ